MTERKNSLRLSKFEAKFLYENLRDIAASCEQSEKNHSYDFELFRDKDGELKIVVYREVKLVPQLTEIKGKIE